MGAAKYIIVIRIPAYNNNNRIFVLFGGGGTRRVVGGCGGSVRRRVNIFFDGDNIGGGPGRPSRLVKPTQYTHTHKTNRVLVQIIRECVCARARDKHLEGRE